MRNDANNLENDWTPGTWVLIWEYSLRTFQWIPTWQGSDSFLRFLHSCALKSSLSIGRVKNLLPWPWEADNNDSYDTEEEDDAGQSNESRPRTVQEVGVCPRRTRSDANKLQRRTEVLHFDDLDFPNHLLLSIHFQNFTEMIWREFS